MEITVEILERELCKDKKRRPTKIKIEITKIEKNEIKE